MLLCVMIGGACARAAEPSPQPAASGPHFGQRLARDLRAPLHGDAPWILAGGGALAAISLHAEDADSDRRALDGSAFDGAFDVGNEFGSGWVLGSLALGSVAVGSLGDAPGLSDFGLDLGSSLLAVSAYSWSLKLALDRPRPNGAPHSFPSGHTAAAFATAAVLDRHSGPLLSFAGYALATATMGGRMEENRHYLSDVVFGAALGLSVGGATMPRVERGWLREHFTVAGKGVAFRTRF